jgi:NADH-quinone oxidoreductase subunit C
VPEDQLPFDNGTSADGAAGAGGADPRTASSPEPATDEQPEATSSADPEAGRESGRAPDPGTVPPAADPGGAQHDPAPPSGSPAVAAETAPAQVTGGSSHEVDTVPAPQPEAPVYRHGMFGAHGSGDTSGFGGLQRRVPVSAGATRPYGSWFDAADEALATTVPDFGDAIEKVVVDRGELTYHVRKSSLLAMLQTLRDDPSLRFELLSSVSGVHYPDDVDGRPLHSIYQLTSLTYRRRLRVEVATTDEDPHIPSAVGVYPTADWQERETFDMFGIEYDGHPGLTRVLMPDDWVGHPQRKDYPLGGIPVEYKGASIPPPDERRSYS